MAVRQYIGARYVPIFGRKGEQSIQWDNTGTYEPLTVVLYQGNSYTSRQFVPVGVEITNQDYWAETGNYNAQVEQYRQEVLGFDDEISANATAIDALQEQMAGTADSALKTSIVENADAIDALQDQMAGTADSALKNSIGENSDAIDALSEQNVLLAGRIDILDELCSRLAIGGTVMPSYVGSFEGDEQHSACVRVGNDIYTLSVNNYDGMGTVRVWSLSGNNLLSSRQALLGHGNSIAFDSVRNCFWVAPMNTYNAGVATETNVVYRYNTQFTSRVELSCAERIVGLSFDHVTETLYAFATANGTEQIRVYSMGSSDESFSLLCVITNQQFAEVGYTSTVAWQDFAVYNSRAIIERSEGTCFLVDLSNETPTVEGTVRISHLDSGGIWKYGEAEGIEFDSLGRLYAMQQCACGFTNAGMHSQHAIGFVTEINTQTMISIEDCNLMSVYGSLTLVADTVFGLGRSEVHSPNELLWRADTNWSKLTVPSNSSFTFERVRFLKDVILEVNGTLTINNIIDLGCGNFFLYINGGTVNFNTPTGYNCIASSTRTGVFSIRSNNGHLVIANDVNFFSAGFTPMLVCIGVLDNIDSVKINGNARSANTLCMGSNQVWTRT